MPGLSRQWRSSKGQDQGSFKGRLGSTVREDDVWSVSILSESGEVEFPSP